MKTEKKTKMQRIAELERKLFVAEASQSYRHHFASKALNKLSTDNFMGSGLIVSITLLSGAPAFEPVMISGGLSKETITALKADLVRSFNYDLELKPDGA